MKKDFYKARQPYETIQYIRDILYKTGIFVMEFSDSHGDFYHSHVVLANEGLPQLSISTNGKGRSPEYSLASAYAEMMERLQNNFKLFGEKYATKSFIEKLSVDAEFRKRIERNGIVLDFELFPDEKHIDLKELISEFDNAASKLIGKDQISYLKQHIDLNKKILCIPYYNVFKHKTEFLPARNIITGSNGMCAGNIPEEALVQGLCEIFERFVLKKIFLNDFVLPQIPLSFFQGTNIYNKILKLRERKNLEIVILDGSMQMGLPVIGVLIINKNDQKYRLEMGGATDPEIALERCLTEHFQASNPINHMNKITDRRHYLNRNDKEIKYINNYHQMIDGDGELDMPEWLLKKPSYSFKELIYIKGNNHKEELQALIAILKNNNYELLVRDNSILGFPAYHIYVPGMSEVFQLLNDDDFFVELRLNEFHEKLYNIKEQSKEDILSFCNIKDQMYDKARSTFRTIKGEFLYHTNDEINEINPYLLLATLYFYCGENKKTIKYIGRFIEDEKRNDAEADLTYFYCTKHYLELIELGIDITVTINKLLLIYSEEIVNEVAEDLCNPDNALQYYNLPTCFECEKCPIKSDCKYFDVIKVVKKIHEHSRTDIDQIKLKDVFI